MSEVILERIARAMEEQLKWTRLAGMSQLKTIFEQNLKTDQDKLVYDLSDGERSTREIEKIVGVSRTKISALWKKWYRMGLMERSAKYEGKRMARSFSLEDVGMEVPPIPQTLQAQDTSQQTKVEEFE